MRPRLIAVGAVLAAVVLSLSGTPVYGGGHGGGGHGGGGGGGFSGGHGGSPGYSGGGGRGYSGSRGYAGGVHGRATGSYGRAYYPGSTSGRLPSYSSRATIRSRTSHSQISSPRGTQRYSINRSLAEINRTTRTTRVSSTDRTRGYRSGSTLQQGRSKLTHSHGIATRDGTRHQGNWSRHNPANTNRFDRQTQNRLRNWHGRTSNFAEARQRHHEHHGNHDGHHHHHDHDWWHNHCSAIVLVNWGYWGWYDGWWYPAWGYDPYYSYYAYDAPIYGYDGLPPDEIVANVQSELQRLGYYTYAVDGILGPLTQDAISRYQRDNLLPITGAIDPATVGSLGLTYGIADDQ
jgi:hypothetical protein